MCASPARNVRLCTLGPPAASAVAGARQDRQKAALLQRRPRRGVFLLGTALSVGGSETERILDPRAVDYFLAYGYVPSPLSIFKGVRKLPPAHTLVFEDGEATIERYWRLDYSRKLQVTDPRELREPIRDHVRRATRRRMIADVPLGAFLSGGIDSSAVVAAMAEASTTPVKTFSIGFESEAFDEVQHARRISRTVRDRSPRVRRSSRRDRDAAQDRAPVWRAVRRRIGNPLLLSLGVDAAAKSPSRSTATAATSRSGATRVTWPTASAGASTGCR